MTPSRMSRAHGPGGEPSMKTTVVHVVGTLRDGGAETLLRGLLPRLATSSELDVHVISVYDPRLDEDERVALGATLHVIGRRGRSDLRFAPRLLATLRSLRPDVVHGHIHTGKYAGRIGAIAAGVPAIVFTEHGDEAGGALRWLVKRVLNARTDRFIVFTDAERERYAAAEGISPAKIAVIANGITIPPLPDRQSIRERLGIQPGTLAIVSAARLVTQKNQSLAIRALAQLRMSGHHNLRLFVIGDGPDAGALHQLVDELSLRSIVSFLGYRKDALEIVASSDIMVLPSLWEKMPLVLGEAMLANVPVVSSPWTGVKAFIEDGVTGYLSPDWSVDGFSSALLRAIEAPADRANVAIRASRFAATQFDLTTTVERHIELYRTLASPRSRPAR